MVLLLRQDEFPPEAESEEVIQKLNAIRYDYKSNGGYYGDALKMNGIAPSYSSVDMVRYLKKCGTI